MHAIPRNLISYIHVYLYLLFVHIQCSVHTCVSVYGATSRRWHYYKYTKHIKLKMAICIFYTKSCMEKSWKNKLSNTNFNK